MSGPFPPDLQALDEAFAANERDARALVAGLVCARGRAQVGRYHASAVVSLERARTVRLAALLGPLEPGMLRFHAVAVTDEDEVELVLVTHVTARADDGSLAAACEPA